MNKRIFAIIALVLFAIGLIIGGYSLVADANELAPYTLLMCAPGALMAFLNYMAQKRAAIEGKEEGEHHESEVE